MMREDRSASTLDAFHRGRYWLVQPERGGHRAGIDAMVLAAAVPSGFSGVVADFGSGAGAAGLGVASRCPGARVLLIERSPAMARFAELTLARTENSHLAARLSLIRADVTLAGTARSEAGLADRSLDFVIMNPPFNAGRDRPTPDRLKQEAHVMEAGLFEAWLRSAAAVLRPRGGIALIARPASLPDLFSSLSGRFGGAEVVLVHPRPEQAAIRAVVRAWRGSRAPLSFRPPLILHGQPGDGFTLQADAINNGRASLFGD